MGFLDFLSGALQPISAQVQHEMYRGEKMHDAGALAAATRKNPLDPIFGGIIESAVKSKIKKGQGIDLGAFGQAMAGTSPMGSADGMPPLSTPSPQSPNGGIGGTLKNIFFGPQTPIAPSQNSQGVSPELLQMLQMVLSGGSGSGSSGTGHHRASGGIGSGGWGGASSGPSNVIDLSTL